MYKWNFKIDLVMKFVELVLRFFAGAMAVFAPIVIPSFPLIKSSISVAMNVPN